MQNAISPRRDVNECNALPLFECTAVERVYSLHARRIPRSKQKRGTQDIAYTIARHAERGQYLASKAPPTHESHGSGPYLNGHHSPTGVLGHNICMNARVASLSSLKGGTQNQNAIENKINRATNFPHTIHSHKYRQTSNNHRECQTACHETDVQHNCLYSAR